MSTVVAVKKAHPIVEYLRGFAVLRETRREYWGSQVVNFLDHAAYYTVSPILTVYFSKDFGFNDVHAGYVFSAFTLTVTIGLWVSGFITDWLGIRKSLILSMIATIGLRALVGYVGLTPDFPFRNVVAVAGIVLLAPFMAMTTTVFQAANRRFTTARSRGAGFNLWYLFMNLGYVVGGLSLDFIRRVMEWPNSYVMFVGVITGVLSIIATLLWVRREDQLLEPGEAPRAAPAAAEKRSFLDRAMEVFQEPVFYRFLLLVVLLLGVRACFMYLHAIFPKYWLRVIGPDALIGTLQTVNPALVCIGLVIAIPILSRFRVYDMLTYGAIITALSLYIMAIPSHGNMTYVITILCLVPFTIGEIIWSPRLTEYTAAIAPKGQEGTYLGLSMVPWFFAKTLVTGLSGHMLNTWIPDEKAGGGLLRDRLAAGEVPFIWSPSMLWIILATAALIGPLIALLMRGFFTKGAHFEKHANAH